MVPFNDANALEDLLKEKHNEIGTLMIEPILGNCCSISATQEYMEAVRELCTKYDIILIIDEVKTGFRVAKGGVQELYGVEADLCTFAKSIANGYPIAALLTGKEEYMRNIKYGGVLHGGTLQRIPLQSLQQIRHWKFYRPRMHWKLSQIMEQN